MAYGEAAGKNHFEQRDIVEVTELFRSSDTENEIGVDWLILETASGKGRHLR